MRFVRRSPRGAWCDSFDTMEKQPNCQHGAHKYGVVKVTRFAVEMYDRVIQFKCTRGARWRGKGGFAEQTCALCVCSSEPEAPERARAKSEPSAMSESEPSALSEFELIARDTNPFMEAWKRAANSCVAPAMDEDALPTSEDELEEELGAIQPVNPLEYKQRTAGWRCRWFHGKKSRCFEPRECRKCSRRLSELQDRLKRQREEIERKYVMLHVEVPVARKAGSRRSRTRAHPGPLLRPSRRRPPSCTELNHERWEQQTSEPVSAV